VGRKGTRRTVLDRLAWPPGPRTLGSVTTPTPSDPGDPAELAERLDEPSGRLGPEPSRRTGATASERAAAQTVGDLSEPERLDGSGGDA
jgi:hypothetical protein